MARRVVIQGDERLIRRLTELTQGLDDLRVAGQGAGALVAELAASQAPVDTGALRDDIRTFATKTNAGVRVGRKRLPYAGPIVGGHGAPGATRAQGGYIAPPRPFIYDAFSDKAKAIEATYDEFIEDLMAGRRPKSSGKYRIHEES